MPLNTIRLFAPMLLILAGVLGLCGCQTHNTLTPAQRQAQLAADVQALLKNDQLIDAVAKAAGDFGLPDSPALTLLKNEPNIIDRIEIKMLSRMDQSSKAADTFSYLSNFCENYLLKSGLTDAVKVSSISLKLDASFIENIQRLDSTTTMGDVETLKLWPSIPKAVKDKLFARGIAALKGERADRELAALVRYVEQSGGPKSELGKQLRVALPQAAISVTSIRTTLGPMFPDVAQS